MDWQKKLKAANVDDATYEKALATELRSLLCATDVDAIYILRGAVIGEPGHGRLTSTGREAPALIEFIMSKDCPVSASLTDDDKAMLLEIYQRAKQKFPHPPAAKK